MIIARRKRFFRGTLANFCKSKKCIIFNVDYRPGLKKSKFDMTLIGHSPFKAKIVADRNFVDNFSIGIQSCFNSNVFLNGYILTYFSNVYVIFKSKI